jgi:hypothetical protein
MSSVVDVEVAKGLVIDVGVAEGLVVWIVWKVKLVIKVNLVGSVASVWCDTFEMVGSVAIVKWVLLWIVGSLGEWLRLNIVGSVWAVEWSRYGDMNLGKVAAFVW